MATPFTRAKVKDNVDALDNVTAYLEPEARQEVVDYIMTTLDDLESVMTEAMERGEEPITAYRAFVSKFKEYWFAPVD